MSFWAGQRHVSVQQNLAEGIQNTDVHRSGMQIESAVVSVMVSVISYAVSSFDDLANQMVGSGVGSMSINGMQPMRPSRARLTSISSSSRIPIPQNQSLQSSSTARIMMTLCKSLAIS